MDGRAQKPVIEYLEKQYGIDYVDMITEPGPNKVLAENSSVETIESIKKRVALSVEKHHSDIIVIAGHYDCAGNPADEAVQKEHLRASVSIIDSWGFPVGKLIALWLDEQFQPNVID